MMKSTMGSSTTKLSLSLSLFVSLLSCVHSLDHQYWITELLSANQRVNSPENRDLQSASSRAACQAVKSASEVIASNGQQRVLCNCVDVQGGTNLFCIDGCNFCSDDDTSCGLQSFGFNFDTVGAVSGLTLGFQYITEGEEIIFIDYTDCQGQGGDVTCGGCSVNVDGTTCNSCTVTTCADGSQGSQFTCDVVEPGSSIDTCDENLLVADESVFRFLTTEPGNFDTCFLGGTAIFPTATPVNSPPPTFINSTECTLNIGLNQCGPLIAQTEEVEGCECYNYCGGSYAGCCAQAEGCDLVCGGDQSFVAGCRFDGEYPDEPVGPACVLSLPNGSQLTIEDGESFGNLVTNECGTPAEFPCFCATITEDDAVSCPYCPFETQDGSTVCARDGETIQFLSAEGTNLSCACEYLGNNLIQSICENLDGTPVQECVLTRETGQCSFLTAFVNPIEDCDCYNFCEGEYSGCCKYGEPCTAACTTESEITAGCEIDPNKPPVQPPPTQPPVDPPRECRVAQNTEKCAELTQGQTLIEDCDCYNYCGNEYAGCCQIGNEVACSVACSGLQDGEVLTAGCLLPAVPVCGRLFESCEANTDCCSGRCLRGSCRTSIFSSAAKKGGLKLSKNRGGAGGGGGSRPGTRRKLGNDEGEISIVKGGGQRFGRVKGA